MAVAFLLCGPSLSGKTRLRARLCSLLSLPCIAFDEINAARGLPLGALGSAGEWALTLDLALAQTRALLSAGQSLVVDDTLCYRWLRNRLRDVITAAGATSVLLHLSADADVLWQRYRALDDSRSRAILSPGVFDAHLRSFEPPTDEEEAIFLPDDEAIEEWLHGLSSSPGHPGTTT